MTNLKSLGYIFQDAQTVTDVASLRSRGIPGHEYIHKAKIW